MFIRPIHVNKNGKRHAYWALVESYRTEQGPRQRTVAYLGQLDRRGRLGIHQLAQGNFDYQRELFEEVQPQWIEIDARRIQVENCRQFGGCWLALKLLKKLGIASLFETVIPQGKEDVHWAVMAQVLIVCRFCDPSSELYIAEHLYERTVLSDLLGLPCDKLNDDRLYRALDALLPHKQALEVHLKERLGELLNLKYDLLRYDVTSTYFESRDKRGDCKQVCIGLEVKCCSSPEGQETYILCRSEDRAQKEKAILERFEKRIEEGLSKIEASCLKRKYKLVTIAKSV